MDIKIDSKAEYIEICGMKYSFELFEMWGRNGMEKDTVYRILSRDDGMITIQTIDIGGLRLPD